MALSLRQAIIQRVQGKSEEDLLETIEASINGEEQALPGIGVLFEMIWMQADPQMQQQLVTLLHKHLTTKESVPTVT